MLRSKANTSLNPSHFFIKLNVTAKIEAADTVKKGITLCLSTQVKNVGTK